LLKVPYMEVVLSAMEGILRNPGSEPYYLMDLLAA
jgi:hypothetical protein